MNGIKLRGTGRCVPANTDTNDAVSYTHLTLPTTERV